MMVVFCRDPLEPSRPDRAFGAEAAVVERLGLPYVLIDHDALVRDADDTQAGPAGPAAARSGTRRLPGLDGHAAPVPGAVRGPRRPGTSA